MEITREKLLEAMVQHETATLASLESLEGLGWRGYREQLQQVLSGLVDSSFLTMLNGVTPETYTITEKGISEGKKLADAQHLKIAHSFGYGSG